MQIYINNTPVPFDKISLSLALRSPLFNEADGSYIYNFTMPATSELKKALGFAHRINTPRTTEADFMLQQGSVFIKGTAIVSRADDNNYEIAVGVGKGDFNYKIKDKLLTDNMFSWDEVEILQIAKAENNGSVFNYYREETYNFLYTVNIEYPVIISNPNNTINSTGTNYTCYANGYYWMKFVSPNCVFQKPGQIFLGSCILQIIKNGSVYYQETLIANRVIFRNLNLNSGDVISFRLVFSPTPLPGGKYYLGFTVFDYNYFYFIENVNSSFFDSINYFYPDRNFVLFPTYNKSFFDSIKNSELKKLYDDGNVFVQNFYNDPEFPLYINYISPEPPYDAVTVSNIFVPYLYVGYIIENIFNQLGFSIKNNIFINTEWKQLVLYNTFSENDYRVEDVSGNLSVEANVTAELKNHLIPMKISDFLNGICMHTAHIILVNNESKEIEFVSVDEIIKSVKTTDFNQNAEAYQKEMDNLFNGWRLKYNPQDDKYIDDNYNDIKNYNYKGQVVLVSSVSVKEINDLYFETSSSEYKAWVYNDASNVLAWVSISKDFLFYEELVNDNILEKSTDLCPIMTETLYDEILGSPSDRFWLLPITQQSGKFKFGYETIDVKNMPSLLMYRGMYNDNNDIPYPLATNHVNKYGGTKITEANLSLRMDTQYGLYERWKAFLQYIISCKKINIEKQLSEKEFKDLMFSQKYRMFHKNILLNEVKIKITDKTIETEEITGFTD